MTADGPISTSAGHIFNLFREQRVQTRRELIALTGLARSTVTQRVDALLAAGFLREEGVNESAIGRRPKRLVPDYEPKTILAADLGATHGRLAVLDGSGRILAETAVESRIDNGPVEVLGRTVGHWKELLHQADRSAGSVCGLGLGVPGPVDVTTGRLTQPPIMPGWDAYPIRDFLANYFDAAVFVENDANLMALGESLQVYPQLPSLLFVKVATGIGAGLVLDGRIYDGFDGGAGDIGHAKVSAAEGKRCNCGAEGCLAAVSSGAALARQLAAKGHSAGSSRDVVRLVQEGNGDAISATRDAGRVLGEVLATSVSLLNPAALVLGGDMALTYEHFLTGVREVLYSRTQPLAIRRLHVGTSQLGDQAGIVGAAVLVREQVFSAAAVDRALAVAPQVPRQQPARLTAASDT